MHIRRRATPCGHRRRGSAYLLTLGVSLVVSLLGLTALRTVQIQRRQATLFDDAAQAHVNARTALDMALYRVRHDADWRTQLQAGAWTLPQPAGRGTYQIEASDPNDGNIANNIGHPVVVVGTGRSGEARQKLQMRLNVLIPGLRCLEPAIHAAGGLVFDGGASYSDRFVSAGDDLELRGGAALHADAQAADQLLTGSGGGTFHGTTSSAGPWPRQMPDPQTLYQYYLANGTAISIADVPWWDDNLLPNPGAESGVTGWTPFGSCALSLDTEQWRSGSRSLQVSSRTSVAAGPGQNVTNLLESGQIYRAEAWVHVSGNGNADNFRISLKLDSTGAGPREVACSSWQFCDRNQWTRVAGSALISWTGALTEAVWHVETQNATSVFRVDDAVLRINSAPPGWKTIHRRLLSPNENPFGAGTLNAQGIYVLDCGGAPISIRNSRISGTLVLLNQRADSRIDGAIHWAPAVISADPGVTNLPALLTNSPLTIAPGAEPLDESLRNVNFNPPGTPYNDAANTSRTDSYPPLIKGVVYCGGALRLENAPVLHGALVGDSITIAASALRMTYDPVYFETNAPPGFRAPLLVLAIPGSFQRVVD